MEKIEEKKERHFFRTFFFILVLIITLIIVYSKFLGTKDVVVNDIYISSKTFPDSFKVYKIAHFSDVLYKKEEDIELIDQVVEKINDKKVDIIIFSGNLTKSKYKLNEKEINTIISKLSKLQSKYGKYYVSGNDDKSDDSYDKIMLGSGFISLNDNKDTIYSTKNEKLLLVGLDVKYNSSFVDEVLNSQDTYKIVFFSNSDNVEYLKDKNIDLLLSSNSLNGQINIPIVKEFIIREGSKNYINNYYKINNKDYYISNGIGTDNIEFRLFNKPSVNIYSIKNM